MVGVAVSVKVDIGQAQAALVRARDLGLHPGPLLGIAGGILEESTRERFRTGRGPGGIPWPVSNRQRFAARPGSKGGSAMGPNPGGRTLVATGGLESSVTHVADDQRVEVGIIAKTQSAKFAYVHHFGATIRPKAGASSGFVGPSRGGRTMRRGEEGPVRDHARARHFLVFTAPDGHKVFARQVVIPARPIVGVDDLDRADLVEAWTDYIESELAK